MEIRKLEKLNSDLLDQINLLWNKEFPVQLINRFELLLKDASNIFHYLIEEDHRVIAWAVAFELNNETRFSIIVDSNFQGKGFGKMLLNRLKFELGVFYGWVIDHNNDFKSDGKRYMSPLSFYANQGFEVLNDRVEDHLINAVKIRRKVEVFGETDRFILREILQTDRDALFELDSDPEVHRFLGNNPVLEIDKIVSQINYIRTQYLENRIGRWAIVDKVSNEFVGWCGLKFVTEETNGHVNFYDIGYRLLRKFWKQGIAYETALEALRYAFEEMKIEKLYAAADCNNAASNKILVNLGLQLTETFYYTDIKCNWYEMSNANYWSKVRE